MPATRIEVEQTDRGWIGTVEAGAVLAGRRCLHFPQPGEPAIASFAEAMTRVARLYREITGAPPPAADAARDAPPARRKPR